MRAKLERRKEEREARGLEPDVARVEYSSSSTGAITPGIHKAFAHSVKVGARGGAPFVVLWPTLGQTVDTVHNARCWKERREAGQPEEGQPEVGQPPPRQARAVRHTRSRTFDLSTHAPRTARRAHPEADGSRPLRSSPSTARRTS